MASRHPVSNYQFTKAIRDVNSHFQRKFENKIYSININAYSNKFGVHSKKRMNTMLGVNEGYENILLEWFQQMCFVNMPISRPILHQRQLTLHSAQK
jgi:hypothetical protein